MEAILLWKKTKIFSGLLIIPNIITEKWVYKQQQDAGFYQNIWQIIPHSSTTFMQTVNSIKNYFRKSMYIPLFSSKIQTHMALWLIKHPSFYAGNN